jgi:rhodanese-related sulfurtransferase
VEAADHLCVEIWNALAPPPNAIRPNPVSLHSADNRVGAYAMVKTFMIAGLLLGMVLGMQAQGTDPEYARKLKSLYKSTVPLITPHGLAQEFLGSSTPLILDTRTPSEYAVSHIATAQFVDYGKFNKKVARDWDPNRPVVVYCTVGYRSERIGEQLKQLGFKDVRNLYGGIFEWVNEGHPIVDASGKATTKVHAYSEDWGKWLLKGQKVYQ